MSGFFVHEKLEAYKVAREFVAFAHGLRVGGEFGDQLSRAAGSAMLNTAEGAARRGARDKARFFDIARGSAAECAAVLDLLALRGLVAAERAAHGRALLERAVRLLSGLARSSLARGA